MKHKLELYYFPECPFCQIVLSKIESLGLNDIVTFKHIYKDNEALEKLVEDTGRKTVPCLYIDGRPMHESAAIVQWLDANT